MTTCALLWNGQPGRSAWAYLPPFSDQSGIVQGGLPQLYNSSVAWGDYDNDGRLDFLITGFFYDHTNYGRNVSQLWRNTGSGFIDVTASAVPGLAAVRPTPALRSSSSSP